MAQKLVIESRSVVEMSIYGRDLSIKKPTFKAVSEMQNLLDESGVGGKATLEIFSRFLEDSGLPKDLIDEMEVDHLTEVVKVLCEPKKK